MIQCSYKVVSK